MFAASQPGTPGPGAALRGSSPLTAPLSVSLSLSPLQSAQRLEEAPEETASEWLPSRWFLSKPLFQPAPGFVHTRSGCSRRGMELGTPGIQQEDHGDPIRCLEMCRLAAWGVWQDMGRFRKPLGPQTLCVPSGDRVSLGHSRLCSSEPCAEGQQLLSPHPDLDHGAASSPPCSQDLGHTATSSPSAWASRAIARALVQANPGAWQSLRAMVALLAMPPWSKREAGSRARMELGFGRPASWLLCLFSHLQLGMKAERIKPPSNVRRPPHPHPGRCGWRSWATQH